LLGNLFLIQSVEFIEEEPRFESTASISKLVISIANDIFPNSETYITRIKEIAEGLEANTHVQIPEVGSAISQCNSLLKGERFSDARNTVCSLIKLPRYKENSDLYFMLAKTEYEDPGVSNDLVRKALSEAFIKGQRKPAFFEMWYQTEKNSGIISSILAVCEHALQSMGKLDAQWGERYAYASFELAKSTADFDKKIRNLVKCHQISSKLIKISTKEKWLKFKELNVQVVDMIWDESLKHSFYEVAGRAIINAINTGDIRSINFNRMIEIAQFFCDEKTVSDEAFLDLRDCLELAPELIRENSGNRELLAIKLDQAYRKLKVSIRNKQIQLTAS